MDGLIEAFGRSLGWLLSQLLAGRLPRKILLIVGVATIAGGMLALYQAATRPTADNPLWYSGLMICLGSAVGFVGGIALIWLTAWSLTPVWSIDERRGSPEVDAQAHVFRADLTFSNTGFGTAKNLTVRFEAKNGHQPVDAVGLGHPTTPDAIDTGETHRVQLYWHRDKPLDGELVLATIRKSGFGSEHKFHVRTYLSKNDPGQGWCDVRPGY